MISKQYGISTLYTPTEMNNKDNIKLLHENNVWYLLWVFDFICDKLCSY